MNCFGQTPELCHLEKANKNTFEILNYFTHISGVENDGLNATLRSYDF